MWATGEVVTTKGIRTHGIGAAAKEAAAAGPVQQVMVRLDPEALGQVEAQVNRVQFTMQVDEVDTVDAGGTALDLGGTF